MSTQRQRSKRAVELHVVADPQFFPGVPLAIEQAGGRDEVATDLRQIIGLRLLAVRRAWRDGRRSTGSSDLAS